MTSILEYIREDEKDFNLEEFLEHETDVILRTTEESRIMLKLTQGLILMEQFFDNEPFPKITEWGVDLIQIRYPFLWKCYKAFSDDRVNNNFNKKESLIRDWTFYFHLLAKKC